MNVYVGEDKKLHFTDSEGEDSVIPFNPVQNVIGQIKGNKNTVSLGFQPDYIYVEFGNAFEIKRLYSIYSGNADGITVSGDGFSYSFGAGNTSTPCRYRAIKFT